jgi:hypothetical protein
VRIGLDHAQLGDTVQLYEHGRRNNAAPDVHDEVGAATKQAALGMSAPQCYCLIQSGWLHDLEFGKCVH